MKLKSPHRISLIMNSIYPTQYGHGEKVMKNDKRNSDSDNIGNGNWEGDEDSNDNSNGDVIVIEIAIEKVATII